MAEGQPDAERHAASGRRGQGRVRCELRGVSALPSSRGEDGGPDRVDEGPGAGVHVRSKRGLCQHSEIEAAGEERRDSEELATAGGRNQDHVIRPGSDRHRAHQSAGRLCPAIQHRGGVHPGSDDGGRRQEDDDDADEAVAAGLIGFTAGIAIGAAMDNNYYYGPYGWHGGGYMYNDAWDDYYDHREDAREDWQDHREDLAEERGDRAENRSEQRTERAGTTQEQRTDRQETRQETRPESQAQRTERSTQAQGAATQRQAQALRHRARRSGRTGSAEARGYGEGSRTQATPKRNSGSSDAFSGYSSGRSQRSSSARGQQSRGSSRARAGAEAGAAAGEASEEVDTHDQDDRYESIRRPSRTHAPQPQRSSVRVCVAGASRIIGDRRGTDRDAAHVCDA